jgi:hypothetical protein
MTEAELQQRLQQAMGPPSAQPTPPDPAILDAIRRRASTLLGGQVHRSTVLYRNMLAAGVAATIAVLAWWATDVSHRLGSVAELPPSQPRTGPPNLPAAPSWWWLALVAGAGIALTGLAHRQIRDRLVTLGLACLAAGVLAMTLVTLSGLRSGAELVGQAPAIDGYQLVGASLQFRPEALPPHRQATVTYAPLAGTAPLTGDVTRSQPLEPWALNLGFSQYYADLGQRCIQRPSGRPGAGAWEGDFYCLVTAVDDHLQVAATDTDQSAVGWFRPAGWFLLLFGLLCLVLARIDGRHAMRRPASEQIRFGLALTLLTGILLILSQTAADLVRVGPFGFAQGCNVPFDAQCAEQIRATIAERNVAAAASRLYYPVTMLFDLVGFVIGALAWRLAGRSNPSRRRRALLLALIAAVVVAFAFQIVFYQRFRILGDYNE